MLGLDFFSLSLLVGGCVALGSGLFVWLHKSRVRLAWGMVSISTAVWSFGYFFVLVSSNEETAQLPSYLLHAGAIVMPVAFTYFVGVLTKQARRYSAYIQTLVVMAFIFEILNATPLLVSGTLSPALLAYVPNAGPLYIHFAVYFFATMLFTWHMLMRAMRTVDVQEELRLKFVLMGSVAGVAAFASVFPYSFGIDIAPWPVVLIAPFAFIVAYAITQQKMVSARTTSSEIFITSLWFVFLMRTALASSFAELILELAVLTSSIVFGVLLLRNIYKEVEIRERGERLARYLANANARLRELDKQKTEFVSLASHQLRGPIAAIVGYVSLVQEGSYGVVSDNLKEPLSRIFESGKRISLMVDDFLNVTRIEQGRISYRFTTCDITPIIARAVEEFRVLAEKKGLTITFNHAPEGPVLARVDEAKFAQVLQNLIDNAVKFTVAGSVTVSVRSNERKTKALVTIADTGIGIAPEEVHNLSHKFNRASNANSVSVYGSGLGLYISKEILKAHDGWIYISSTGIGKGSVFTVELPIERGEKLE